MSDEHPNAAERTALMIRTAPGARRLAARLENDPSMMAWVLAQFRAAEDKDDQLMAQYLGIEEYRLPHLALCQRPRDDLFRGDIDAIAEHIGLDPRPLAHVVRRVGVLEAFGQLASTRSTAPGLIAAARDRAAEDSATYDAGTAGDAPAEGADSPETPLDHGKPSR